MPNQTATQTSWDRLLLLALAKSAAKIGDGFMTIGRVRWAIDVDSDGLPVEKPALRTAIETALEAA